MFIFLILSIAIVDNKDDITEQKNYLYDFDRLVKYIVSLIISVNLIIQSINFNTDGFKRLKKAKQNDVMS